MANEKEMRPGGNIGAHNPSTGTSVAVIAQRIFEALQAGTVEELLAESWRKRGAR